VPFERKAKQKSVASFAANSGHMRADAERWDWHDNAGAGWHFRGDEDWKNLPQPSTRAAAVLDLVGVDWRVENRDLGLI
jgi:hypothetical protein